MLSTSWGQSINSLLKGIGSQHPVNFLWTLFLINTQKAVSTGMDWALNFYLCALNFLPRDFGEATCTCPTTNSKGNLLSALILALDRKLFVHIKLKEHRPEDCSVRKQRAGLIFSASTCQTHTSEIFMGFIVLSSIRHSC